MQKKENRHSSLTSFHPFSTLNKKIISQEKNCFHYFVCFFFEKSVGEMKIYCKAVLKIRKWFIDLNFSVFCALFSFFSLLIRLHKRKYQCSIEWKMWHSQKHRIKKNTCIICIYSMKEYCTEDTVKADFKVSSFFL